MPTLLEYILTSPLPNVRNSQSRAFDFIVERSLSIRRKNARRNPEIFLRVEFVSSLTRRFVLFDLNLLHSRQSSLFGGSKLPSIAFSPFRRHDLGISCEGRPVSPYQEGASAENESEEHFHKDASGHLSDTLVEIGQRPSEAVASVTVVEGSNGVRGNVNQQRRLSVSSDGMSVPHFVDDTKLRIFSGPANIPLAEEIAEYVGVRLGSLLFKTFADGESYVKFNESVRGCDVFLIQPTSCPVNNRLMELMIMIDACRRASARSIAAVIPYFGYARADKLHQNKTPGREAITAKLVANLIAAAGTTRVISVDLHSNQMQGFFDIPLDHVYASPVLLDYLLSKQLGNDLVVVSPDIGGVARARAFAKKLGGAPLAIIDKRRQEHNKAEVVNLIGDVHGKVAVLVDDMIDTAGTIYNGAIFLRKQGARTVFACATHAVFSPPAVERLSSGVFEEVIITNTIPVPAENHFPQLTILSVSKILGETILRVHQGESVAPLFF